LSIFANSLTLIESNSLDYFNESFIRFTNNVRKFIQTPDYAGSFGWNSRNNSDADATGVYVQASKLSFEIVKGDFHIDSKGDGIMHYHNGFGYVVPIRHTSSGQQESIWLINLIHYLLFESERTRFDIIIEEPEAHLFPDAQKDITNLITLLANRKNSRARIILTTHSPYVLATLNNSLKAFKAGQIEEKNEEVNRILSDHLWVNPDSLFVGFMKDADQENTFIVESIFDSESGLIKHEVLDGVSDKLMEEFDNLLDVQYRDE
jgi:hypothetical protein